jgi:DNA ligase-1
MELVTKPTLYKKTATGATQIWYQEIEGNKYRTVSGQMDGQKVTAEWTVCEGKNIGRSNATTPEQQALLEVESNYKKKLAQGGYSNSVNEIDTPNYFKPMLAKDYDDYPVTEEMCQKGLVYSQAKYDGVRCIATVDGLWSRQGKPILSVPHISEALTEFFQHFPDMILDGELYADKFANDFNKIISLVRKAKPGYEDFKASRDHIKYFNYDLPGHGDLSFGERIALRDVYYESFLGRQSVLHPVETHKVESLQHLDNLNDLYLQSGMEGQMVRIDGFPYENKRVKHLLKRKVFKEEEFIIVDVVEGIGNRAGMAGNLTYRLEDGRTFDSGIRGGVDFYKELLKNKEKYIGGQGTVRYFNRTPDGIPRFPVTVAVFEGQRDT